MIRSLVLSVVGLIIFASSLLSIFIARQSQDFYLRGYVNPTQNSNLPFRVPRLGVNADLQRYSETELQNQLANMERTGIIWVRQYALWDELEPEQGVLRWEWWDRLTAEFRGRSQLRLVVTFMNTPAWARRNPADSSTSPPVDNATFAEFVYQFAQRYGDLVDHYQVWDEPNLRDAWGGQNPNPTQYAALLGAAYQAINNADSQATVVAAALAPTTETGPHNLTEAQYLRGLYESGAQPFFDAVAGKPYGFDTSPLDRTVDSTVLNFSRLIALREVMLEYGDGAKPVWAMNWGWNSLPADWSGQPSIWGQVTQNQQIRYTREALARVEREWPWLAGMLIQHWQPDRPLDDPQWGFSLLKPDGSPTLLLNALQQAPVFTSASNGLYEPVNAFARYSGVWSFSPLGADAGWVEGSRATLDFQGTELSLFLRQGNYVAYLYPTVDVQPANAVPLDNGGNAYIVLTSGEQTVEQRLVPVAVDLPAGEHTLQLVADRGWDQWPLLGYAVSDGDLHAPYQAAQTTALISAFFSGCLTIIGLSRLPYHRLAPLLSNLASPLSQTIQWILGGVASAALMVGMLLTWRDSLPNILHRDPVPLGLSFVTVGLIYIQPGFWLTIAAIMATWWIVYLHPEVGVVWAIFWSPFFLFPVELYRFAFPVAEVLVLVTMSAWVLRSIVDWAKVRHNRSSAGLKSIKLNIIDYAVIGWLLIAVVSLTWAEYADAAITDLRVMFIEPALFYLVLRSLSQRNPRVLWNCILTLLTAGVTISAIGLFQYAQGQALITAEDGAVRLASVYGSPNNLGLFLGRCIPFVVSFLLLLKNGRFKLLAALALGLMGLTVLLSQSAGAIFIGVPAAVVAVILLIFKRRALYPLLALLGLVVIGLLIAVQFPRFARLLDFSSGTNFYRLRVWESAVDVIHDHPVLGLGLDQFLYAFRGHYIRPDAWQEPNLSHPHNIILDFWVRLGIAGLFILGAFQIGFWRRMLRQYWVEVDNHQLILLIGAMGCMVNLLAHGLIDNSIYVNDLIYVFMLLLAIAAAPFEAATPETATKSVHLGGLKPVKHNV